MKPTRYQKCLSSLIDADRALFGYTCLSCGHRWKSVLKIGPTGQRKPASPTACAIMAKVWKGYKRMNSVCPKCKKNGTPQIGPRLPL